MNKLSIKKGDTVKVMTGKDKGKSGKVLEVSRGDRRLIIEGLNIHVRFKKARRKGEKGQRLELPALMGISKVMLVCPACGKSTRIGHEITERGSLRKCKKCGQVIA